jgi:hypothetical protein
MLSVQITLSPPYYPSERFEKLNSLNCLIKVSLTVFQIQSLYAFVRRSLYLPEHSRHFHITSPSKKIISRMGSFKPQRHVNQ